MTKLPCFFIFILLTIGIFHPNFVNGQTIISAEIEDLSREIESRKKLIAELEASINVYKKNIAVKQTEAVSLKNQLNILDNRVGQIETDIKLTQAKIDQARFEIQSLEISIRDKKMIIERQKKILVKMVQDIHAEDQKGYLEILLTNNNFATFFSQLKYLESVYKDLGKSVKKLRIDKEDLDYKKIQIEIKKRKYEELKTELAEKHQDLSEQIDTKNKLLADTRSSEKKYTLLLQNLKKQEQAIENEQKSYEARLRKKLAERDASFAETGDLSLSWPVSSRYITATFHDPSYPFRNVMSHSGIDIRASQGTAVKAAASGYIARTKFCSTSSCYSYVLIIHTGNISTVYGHLSGIIVSEDQYVNRGDIIGYSGGRPGTVGAGPFVTGPHLHFEARLNGIPVDPMTYL